MTQKMLIVGLDGATFDIIQPLVDQGRLPNLARLLQAGAWGKLASSVPPVTPAAWTSFFTGKNPGKHGIYNFQEIDPQTYRLYSIPKDGYRDKTIWQLLGGAGLRSIILDVPFTYPPKPLNGLMLTGYGTPRTPETIFTYPANLADTLPPALRPQIKVALPTHKFDRSQWFIDEWREVMNGRSQLVTHLMQNEPWDLFTLVFSITDNMAHVFWTYVDPAHPNYHKPEGATYREAFFDGYTMCDDLLGKMMALAGDKAVTLVLSDHGFGSIRPRQYLLQRLLDGGYCVPKGGNAQRPTPRQRLTQFVMRSYGRFPFLREWVKGLRPQNLHAVKRTLRRANLMPHTDIVDPSRSRIIPSNFGLRLWVNDQARFANGIVSPEEKEALLDDVTAYLLADRDPVNGRQIIQKVHRGDEIYTGEFASRGASLIIEYANFYEPNVANPPQNAKIEGGHTPDGIFLALGETVQPVRLEGSRLIDLAPTILHLFGLPIPPDMDGRILTEMLNPKFLQQNPVVLGTEPALNERSTQGTQLKADEAAELDEQLRQLGYID